MVVGRQEFTVNFLGLPQGFFKMDLSQSQTWGGDEDDDGGGIAKGAPTLTPATPLLWRAFTSSQSLSPAVLPLRLHSPIWVRRASLTLASRC